MRLYQLDAFTDRLFAGNPAAVVPLTNWLPDEQMQRIAAENNLAETAFYVKTDDDAHYHIRWFTPTVEVDLCGHATLATGHVVFYLEEKPDTDQIYFDSRSGSLKVCRGDNGWITLDFPIDVVQRANVQPPALMTSLGGEKPLAVFKGKTDYMVIYETQEQIEALTPDFREMSTVPARGIIVTAPARPSNGFGETDDIDFVSRFFGPLTGIDEDPVTGSAHTTLVPYWAEKLGKTELTACQLSERGGYLRCKLNGDRVDIAGQVQLYMKAEIL